MMLRWLKGPLHRTMWTLLLSLQVMWRCRNRELNSLKRLSNMI